MHNFKICQTDESPQTTDQTKFKSKYHVHQPYGHYIPYLQYEHKKRLKLYARITTEIYLYTLKHMTHKTNIAAQIFCKLLTQW
jgi:hypothetical protein